MYAALLVLLAGPAALWAAAPAPPIPLDKAWIKDMDGDGAGDRVFLDFSQPLAALPATVETQWNQETSAFKSAAGASIAFVGTDSSRVSADFSSQPFPMGLTAPEDGHQPRVRLPSDPVFGGQSAPLLDSLPPVLLKAVASPGYQDGILDTLSLWISEALRTSSDYHGLVWFAAACSDTASVKPVEPARQPMPEPGHSRFLLVFEGGSASPKAGDCLFLDPQGFITDLGRNRPSPKGVILEGRDGSAIHRPSARGAIPPQARPRHTADGRRHPSRGRHSTLRTPNLITFMEAKP